MSGLAVEYRSSRGERCPIAQVISFLLLGGFAFASYLLPCSTCRNGLSRLLDRVFLPV